MTEPLLKNVKLNSPMLTKSEISVYKTAHPKATQDNIANHFSKEWRKTIGMSTISNILKEKVKWVNAGKGCAR